MNKIKELFPVYRLSVSYQDTDGEKKEVDFAETMCPHEQSDEECREKINLIMTSFIKEYPEAKGHISLIDFKEVSKAEWRLIWFSHETFKKFANKAEAFKSFRKFVKSEVKRCHDTGIDTACLMGADESARWAVCGCEDCQKDGRVVINH